MKQCTFEPRSWMLLCATIAVLGTASIFWQVTRSVERSRSVRLVAQNPNSESNPVQRGLFDAALLAGGIPCAPLVLALVVADERRGSRSWRLRVRRRAKRLVVQNHAAALREVSGHLQNMHDDEHRRIARRLHDSTSQNLAAVLLNIAALEADQSLNPRAKGILKQCASLVESSSADVRSVCYELYPPGLDELGLSATLFYTARAFEQRTGIPVEMSIPEDLGRFDHPLELAVFHVVQELLGKTERRSTSDTVSVTVSREAKKLTVTIEDRVAGFGTQSTWPDVDEMALGGLQLRICHVGGNLEIAPTATGNRVTVCVPIACQAMTVEAA